MTTDNLASHSLEPVPFYKTIKMNWKDIPTEGGIPTVEFCLASDAVVDFFNLFNNPAFSVVQNDLSSKLTKIRTRVELYPEETVTIESMLAHEKDEEPKHATGSLTWLCRTLDLILIGLRENLAKPQEEISTSLTRAYEKTLKPHHPYLVRPVFYLAMKTCPYRSNFYPRLGTPTDVVQAELKDWLDGLDRVIVRMKMVYKEGGYGQI